MMNRNRSHGAGSASAKNRNRQGTGRRTGGNRTDNALILRREFQGQPTCTHKLFNSGGPYSTTVTTGVIATLVSLTSANLLPNLATRFVGYDQFRIVKVKATIRMFSSSNPGLVIAYFDDTNAAPTGNASAFASSRRMNASDVVKPIVLTYIPRDPAQQFWSTVSGGSATIGYFKTYTDAANYGSSTVATPYYLVEYESTVQFRGFI